MEQHSEFSTFIVSLSASALLHLGEMPSPEGEEDAVNLALASQTIDILTMLREKTKGNLTAAEEKLLGNFLYDLRMKFVARTKAQQG
jgi:hypothetical protein